MHYIGKVSSLGSCDSAIGAGHSASIEVHEFIIVNFIKVHAI